MTRDKALQLASSAWNIPAMQDVPQYPELVEEFARILFVAVNQPLPAPAPRVKGELTPHPIVVCPECGRRVKGRIVNGRVYPFRHSSRWHKVCPGCRKAEG